MAEQHIFAWGTSRRFNDYSSFVRNKFGGRVQKISVNVGLSCPNRDGTKGTGGCIFCSGSGDFAEAFTAQKACPAMSCEEAIAWLRQQLGE